MMRTVRDSDQRYWTIRSKISWTRPAMADQFEHDMAGGYVSGIAMLGVLLVMTLFVVFWTPTGVVIPSWLGLLFLLILLLLPVLWALQRPWVITAYTADPIGSEGEHWEGIVKGMVAAREEICRIADDLESNGIPDNVSGPLMRIASPGSYHES